MIVKDVIDLLSLARELIQRKGELNRSYYDNFILPVWQKFSLVHENYKDTIKTYTELLKDKNVGIEQIIEQIRKDTIYTEDMRAELRNLVQSLPPAYPNTKEEDFIYFGFSILDYLFDGSGLKTEDESVYYDDDESDYWLYKAGSFAVLSFENGREHRRTKEKTEVGYKQLNNAIRQQAIAYLSRKQDDSIRPHAIKFLNRLVQNLQRRYITAAEAHNKLRVNLLK